jgi:hypothetical protein
MILFWPVKSTVPDTVGFVWNRPRSMAMPSTTQFAPPCGDTRPRQCPCALLAIGDPGDGKASGRFDEKTQRIHGGRPVKSGSGGCEGVTGPGVCVKARMKSNNQPVRVVGVRGRWRRHQSTYLAPHH